MDVQEGMPVFRWGAQRLQPLREAEKIICFSRVWNPQVYVIIQEASNLPEVSLRSHQFVACDGGDPDEDKRCHAPAQSQAPAWQRHSSVGRWREGHQRPDQDHLWQRSALECWTTFDDLTLRWSSVEHPLWMDYVATTPSPHVAFVAFCKYDYFYSFQNLAVIEILHFPPG